jgi:FKBP-type peptidyl-prolyl cis-trans isomerase FklB
MALARFSYLGALLVAGAVLLGACAPKDDPAAAPPPSSDAGQVSYGLGYNTVESLAGQLEEDFNGEAFAQGVADAVAGRPQAVDEAGLNAARDSIVARRQAAADAEAEVALDDAARFLEENSQKEGVTVTASGLQYQVLKRSESTVRPTPEDTVRTHYTGQLADGTVFDSSEARGMPATFGVIRVIPGWQEALQLMAVGDRFKLWIPPELAYGSRGAGDSIPPNAALVFEVELLALNPED